MAGFSQLALGLSRRWGRIKTPLVLTGAYNITTCYITYCDGVVGHVMVLRLLTLDYAMLPQ
jgi:hypothetical protein